jgi:hypothetical protein
MSDKPRMFRNRKKHLLLLLSVNPTTVYYGVIKNLNFCSCTEYWLLEEKRVKINCEVWLRKISTFIGLSMMYGIQREQCIIEKIIFKQDKKL